MIKKFLHTILLLFIVIPLSFSQAGTEEKIESAKTFTKEELQEEQRALTFESSFMDALKQKSIENYDKALESLGKCKSIYPDNLAMLFEMAKNHFKLNHYIEAHHYCNLALQKDSANFWVLELSREIYIKERDYDNAILVQKELYSQKPTEAQNLLRLYYYTKNYSKGKELLTEVDKNNIYVGIYDFYHRYFYKEKITTSKSDETIVAVNDKSIVDLQKDFASKSDYSTLKALLEKENSENQYKELYKDSRIGLSLYPAQATVYLYNGIALNKLNQHKKAIRVLEAGVDFVFDNPELSKRFYSVLIESCDAIKNTKKSNHYKQMVQKL